jgi:hypothetical protein
MAPDTVLLNYFDTGFFDENDLGLGTEGEYGGMPHTVFCLEKVRPEYIIVRHMAIIAACFFAV